MEDPPDELELEELLDPDDPTERDELDELELVEDALELDVSVELDELPELEAGDALELLQVVDELLLEEVDAVVVLKEVEAVVLEELDSVALELWCPLVSVEDPEVIEELEEASVELACVELLPLPEDEVPTAELGPLEALLKPWSELPLLLWVPPDEPADEPDADVDGVLDQMEEEVAPEAVPEVGEPLTSQRPPEQTWPPGQSRAESQGSPVSLGLHPTNASTAGTHSDRMDLRIGDAPSGLSPTRVRPTRCPRAYLAFP